MSTSRLAADVDRWRANGWVSEDGARAIRSELATTRRGVGLPVALAVLGVVLLGFAAMSFVAANWQDLSRITRLGLIFAGLWGSFATAGLLHARRLEGFAEAALLAAISVFGAGIMLIAQMFHIDGNPPDAVLTWAAGAALAGLVLRSNAALAAAALLAALWSGWEMVLTSEVHWPFLAVAGVLAAAFGWQRWRPGLHLVGASVAAWIVALGYLLDHGGMHPLVLVIGLVVMAAGLLGGKRDARLADFGPALTGYGYAIAFAALFALQFIDRVGFNAQIGWGVLALGLSIGLVALALAARQKGLVWLGYAGFSVEILGIYFKTIGTLLGSSLFFLLAGVVVVVLAGVAWRLSARQERVGETVS